MIVCEISQPGCDLLLRWIAWNVLMTLVEVIRRAQWMVFRLENVQLVHQSQVLQLDGTT